MAQPRTFILRQSEYRPATITDALPEIDETRATAVLVRQSKTGADTAQAESRETQLGLQDYGKQLYRKHEPDVRLYDEGAGVSGQKRIDQRKELDRLYQDIHKGIIGTIVLAREDRLFRNKHMDQVGAFTKLAEEKKIKLIVPPISSVAQYDETRLYDFTVYQDLRAFQDKMREAYAYIEGPIKHANQCKQNKADKGGYDGRYLPPGLAVKGKKQDQAIVIYEPWAQEIRKLALRAQALDWDMGKLNREVARKAFLFPEIPEEDRERYIIKTNLPHIPGVGYKPRGPQVIKRWLTNEMYIGWWQPDEDKPDTIIDHHPAILDYALFAEGYAAIKGYTLEGEPVDSHRGITRIRKTRETPPDGLFHGKLIATPPSPGRTAFTTIDEEHYVARSLHADGLLTEKLFRLPVAAFDAVVIERLKALADQDRHIAGRVKATLEQVYHQQSEDFVSIHEQLRGIEIQLAENAEKRLDTSKKDPLYAKLQAQAEELLLTQERLEAKMKKLGIVDSPEEIAQLHSLLGNFDAVWPTFDLAQRQRAFSLLINRIEVEVVSPHWLRLSIDWLDAICPRIDIAYLWKVTPARGDILSEEEEAILREYYPHTSRVEMLRLLPDRTWRAIHSHASSRNIRRAPSFRGHALKEEIPWQVCYRDFMPKLDGNYLFRDYETTLHYIQIASGSTIRLEAPLYALWILSEKVEDLANLFDGDLNTEAVAVTIPVISSQA
ncbi:MAG TPA: recombinase family protein [Ktedonobacteraceae bacterium]|jgi:DNA invertase Pin-like site-specific DNA recombinase|nr:recombinase family protein [Ktedonobacteraceae bacterium]